MTERELMDETLEAGETRDIVVNATYRPCVHGGGWWIAKDMDGNEVLLEAKVFATDEIARLKAQYTAAIVKRNQLRVDRDVWQEAANRYSDQLSTLTADNERLTARVERLESAGNALIDYANKPGTPSMPSQIYVLLDQLLAAIEGRTARRVLEAKP